MSAIAAFDAIAADYDRTFTNTPIGRRMREAVWRRLDVRFGRGQRVLELNCGTGIDAVHLARRGVSVMATDGSAAMLALARTAIDRADVTDRVECRQVALESLDPSIGCFDGALSNFGGLNCVADLPALAGRLARCVRHDGIALVCVMGPVVPWEWGWFALRGQPGRGFRRLASAGVAWRGTTIRYPSIGRLRRAFAPWFVLDRVAALGCLVPPPCADSLAQRHPRLIDRLDGIERRLETAWPLPYLADHYVAELPSRVNFDDTWRRVATAEGERLMPAARPGRLVPRTDPIERLPILVLTVHDRCDCRCVMCDIWKNREAKELTPEDVELLVSDLQALGVRRVGLTGGEPLLHSGLWRLCEPLQAAGIHCTLLTTGQALAEHAVDVARACDEVVVSLDGPPSIHDRIRRVNGAFDRVAAGVASLIARRPRPRMTARCTVQRANVRDLTSTVAAARQAGFDGVSFLAVDGAGGAFGRPAGWTGTSDAMLRAEDLPALAEELDRLERECAADFASGFILDRPLKLRRRLWQHFAAIHGVAPSVEVRCNAPWVSSVIESDGTVRPCFFQPSIGNVRDAGSLVAVLNSPAALAFRRALDVRTDPICRRCVCSLALRQDDLDRDEATGSPATPAATNANAVSRALAGPAS